jgi:hypothetical protein
LLADLARSGTRSTIPATIDADVDSWRRRISQKVEEIQGHIESSKFEPDDFRISEIQQITGDAQIVFILMLSLARQRYELGHMDMVRAATFDVDNSIATALEALATRGAPNSQSAVLQLDDRLNSLERSTTDPDALDQEAAAHFAARLALYRALVAAINPLSSGISEYWTRQIPESLVERGAFFESRETRTN